MRGVDLMKEALIDKLKNAVASYDVVGAVKLASRVLEAGVDPVKAIEEGLAQGVRIVGDRFGAREAFITELMAAAQAMKQAMTVLEPAIHKRSEARRKVRGKIIIGTIEGDIHDIGKTIVSIMLTVEGFEVVDLGNDVPVNKFVEKTREVKPAIIGMSALMPTTMLKMVDVLKALEEEGLRKEVKVIVGGAPTSKEWAQEIGADAYGSDAVEAVKVTKKLIYEAS